MNRMENDRLDQMEDKLDNLNDKVDKIFTALTGDDLQIDRGLIAEYKELRDRVTKLEYLKNKIIWIGIGAGAAIGISLNKIIEWIQEASK